MTGQSIGGCATVQAVGFLATAATGLGVWTRTVGPVLRAVIAWAPWELGMITTLAVITGLTLLGIHLHHRRHRYDAHHHNRRYRDGSATSTRSVSSVLRRWMQPPISRCTAWCRYRHRWSRLMALHGLTADFDDRPLIPRLRSVCIGAVIDTVTVAMVPGQSPDDWHHRSDALAHAFGVTAARVRVLAPAVLAIDFRRTDVLTQVIPLDLTRIPRPVRPTPVTRAGRGGHAGEAA